MVGLSIVHLEMKGDDEEMVVAMMIVLWLMWRHAFIGLVFFVSFFFIRILCFPFLWFFFSIYSSHALYVFVREERMGG